MQKILLHACCGPCSTASIERLINNGWEPVLFFGNSNIFPQAEADLRFEQLQKVAKQYNLQAVRGNWDHDAWRTFIAGHEGDPEHGMRCSLCFEFNLRQACQVAQELGIEHFTTTLTVSRFKNSKTIFGVGEQFPGFEQIDFKKQDGFNRSIVLSKELDLYRQQYCGCEFSR